MFVQKFEKRFFLGGGAQHFDKVCLYPNCQELGEFSMTNCVGYDKLPFYERYTEICSNVYKTFEQITTICSKHKWRFGTSEV